MTSFFEERQISSLQPSSTCSLRNSFSQPRPEGRSSVGDLCVGVCMWYMLAHVYMFVCVHVSIVIAMP